MKKIIRDYQEWSKERRPKNVVQKLAHIPETIKIMRCGDFNGAWYAQQYLDVKHMQESRFGKLRTSRLLPLQYLARFATSSALHYAINGQYEGRSPSMDFDTAYYVNEYQDVREGKEAPILHYARIGKQEKRRTGVLALDHLPINSILTILYHHCKMDAEPEKPRKVVFVLQTAQDVQAAMPFAQEKLCYAALSGEAEEQAQSLSWQKVDLNKQEDAETLYVLPRGQALPENILQTMQGVFADDEMGCLFAGENLVPADLDAPVLPSSFCLSGEHPWAVWHGDQLPCVVCTHGDYRLADMLAAGESLVDCMLRCSDRRLVAYMNGPAPLQEPEWKNVDFLMTKAPERLKKLRRNFAVSVAELQKLYGEMLSWVICQGAAEGERFLKAWPLSTFVHVKPRLRVVVSLSGFTCGGGEIMPIRLANYLDGMDDVQLYVHVATLEPEEERVRAMLKSDLPVWRGDSEAKLLYRFILHRVEVIHTHHQVCQSMMARYRNLSYAKKPPVRHVATSHGMYENFDDETMNYLAAALADKVDEWTYVADKNLKPFKRTGLYGKNFTKVPNGMARPEAHPVDRASLGMEDTSFAFCLVSRALVEKGWLEAVEAAGILRQETGKDIHLILVGEGPAREQLMAQGCPAWVHAVGYSDHALDYFAAADAAILPSYYPSESAPLSLIEAMMLGKPCVASDLGDIREMLTLDGKVAGAVFPLENMRVPMPKLVEAMKQVACAAPEEFEQLRERALAISRRYEIGAVAEQYKAIYVRTAADMQVQENADAAELEESQARRQALLEASLRGENCPHVTVAVPNYNYADCLPKRLESIYGQTYRNFDVLLLDDCSTDDSRQVLESWQKRYPERTQLLFNEKNSGGVFRQWRKGIQAAKGDIVWIAEADDWCEKDYLEQMLPAFDHADVKLVSAQYGFYNEEELIPDGYENYVAQVDAQRWNRSFTQEAAVETADAMGIINTVPNVSGCLFRNPAGMALLDDPQWLQMRICGDWVFYLQVMQGGSFAYQRQAHSCFRFHAGGKSAGASTYGKPEYYKEHAVVAQTAINLYGIPDYTLTKMYQLLEKFHNQNMHGGEKQLKEWFPYDKMIREARQKQQQSTERKREERKQEKLQPVVCDSLWGKTRERKEKAFHLGSRAVDIIRDLGDNSGNLLFVDSVYDGLKDPASIPMHSLFADRVLPGKEAVIMPAANWLICKQDQEQMKQGIKLMEKMNVPVTCAGLGAQSRTSTETPSSLARDLPKETIRFVHILSERATTIGVRGAFTAQVLEELGVHNWRIIGCPSCFWALDGKPEKVKAPTADKPLIHVTSGNRHESHLVDMGMDADAGWVMQMLTELPQLSEGAALDDPSLPYPPERRYPKLAHSLEDLRAYMMRRARVFDNMKDWQDYHREEGFTFAAGTRFHGNMLALRSGIPTLWITHDSRTSELTETLHLPHVSYAELDQARSLADLIPYCDYSDFYANIGRLTRNYVEFLEENGLQHRYTLD